MSREDSKQEGLSARRTMSREDGKQGPCVLTLLEAISPTERRVCNVSSCSRHQSSSSSVSCTSCSPESSGSQVS